jgi:hypothetical protein
LLEPGVLAELLLATTSLPLLAKPLPLEPGTTAMELLLVEPGLDIATELLLVKSELLCKEDISPEEDDGSPSSGLFEQAKTSNIAKKTHRH